MTTPVTPCILQDPCTASDVIEDAETCSAVKRARKVLETSSSDTMSEVEVEFDIWSRIPERNHVI